MMVDERAPSGAVNKNVIRLNSLSNQLESGMAFESEMEDSNINIGVTVSQLCS